MATGFYSYRALARGFVSGSGSCFFVFCAKLLVTEDAVLKRTWGVLLQTPSVILRSPTVKPFGSPLYTVKIKISG